MIAAKYTSFLKVHFAALMHPTRCSPRCRHAMLGMHFYTGVTPMLESLFNLKGRTALVTGGSKGIGKAIARGLAEAGADIAICSRHEDELARAAAEIKEGLSVRVATKVADLTRREDAESLAAWAVQSLGKVDILVN